MADARTRCGRARGAVVIVLAVFAAACAAAILAGCGSSPSNDSADPFVGYWVGGGKGSQMTLVQIQRDGDSYKMLANPDVPAGAAEAEGGSLVVDTHVVTTRITPQADDTLLMEFKGAALKDPVVVTLRRTDRTGYADAATAYGLVAIRRGLAMWKAGGGSTYPPAKEVTEAGMLAQMIRWPVNLFAGRPMRPGAGKGDYTYALRDGGKKYSLVAHLSDGSTIGK